MSNLTRRAILRGSTVAAAAVAVSAIPALAAIPAGNGAPSSEISQLLTEWRDWVARLNGPEDEGYDPDDWIDEHSDAMAEIERAIAATPATSLSDVLIKLRLQATTNELINDREIISDDDAYVEDGELSTHLLLSALRDVERLTQEGGAV
jgi:hypothetical protein